MTEKIKVAIAGSIGDGSVANLAGRIINAQMGIDSPEESEITLYEQVASAEPINHPVSLAGTMTYEFFEPAAYTIDSYDLDYGALSATDTVIGFDEWKVLEEFTKGQPRRTRCVASNTRYLIPPHVESYVDSLDKFNCRWSKMETVRNSVWRPGLYETIISKLTDKKFTSEFVDYDGTSVSLILTFEEHGIKRIRNFSFGADRSNIVYLSIGGVVHWVEDNIEALNIILKTIDESLSVEKLNERIRIRRQTFTKAEG